MGGKAIPRSALRSLVPSDAMRRNRLHEIRLSLTPGVKVLQWRDDSHNGGRHFSSTYHSLHVRIRVLGFLITSAYNSKFVLLLYLFLYSGLYKSYTRLEMLQHRMIGLVQFSTLSAFDTSLKLYTFFSIYTI